MLEHFETGSVGPIVGIMMLVVGAVVSVILVTAYRKERSMFFATAMTIVFIYAVISLGVTAQLGSAIYMGLSAGIALMSIVLAIIFATKSAARLKEIRELADAYKDVVE